MQENKKEKRDRRLLYLALLLLILCGGILILSIFWEQSKNVSEKGKHYVAVITKSTDSDYWKTAFEGVNAACTAYNMEVTIDGPENEEDYELQNQMIEEAVKKGAEAIVFSAVDYNGNAQAIEKAVKAGVKIIVIDSDVNSNKVDCRISTDNYQAGMLAGEAVLESQEEKLNVGIVNFDENSENGQKRENGFRDYVEADERVTIVEALNVNSNIKDAKDNTIEMLQKYPEINVIVTFNEWTSLGVGYAIQELQLEEQTHVVAFDSNVVSVGMLETGEVDALIVQNPYAMGYLGIEAAYQLMNGKKLAQKTIDTTTTLVTRENMYETQYQKVLFHFD